MKKKKQNSFKNPLVTGFSTASIKQTLKAFFYSLAGLKVLLRQRAFIQELVLFIVCIPLAVYLAQSSIELILLIASVVLILIIEAINTAIELTIDRVGTEKNDLSKKAKDVASFSVFLTFILAVFVWIFVILK